ncbi:hypothetical protein D3C76_1390750 [compost metagenome]
MMAREQLLGHAATIVVGQQMRGLIDLQMSQQRQLQISLLHQAVAVPQGLGGIAEADHVTGDNAKTLRKGRPQVVPVPTGGGETVE